VTTEQRLPREQLIEFRAEMLLIRRFEEKVTERFRAGELPGFLHAAIGQEAVADGVCRAVEDGDLIASTHRAHGHVLANGTPATEVMAELYRGDCQHSPRRREDDLSWVPEGGLRVDEAQRLLADRLRMVASANRRQRSQAAGRDTMHLLHAVCTGLERSP
jgi:hypothetical protein